MVAGGVDVGSPGIGRNFVHDNIAFAGGITRIGIGIGKGDEFSLSIPIPLPMPIDS